MYVCKRDVSSATKKKKRMVDYSNTVNPEIYLITDKHKCYFICNRVIKN